MRGVRGVYRPSLLVEVWVALLFYGGRWLDDLALLRSRGVRRLFGWTRVPDPTTFGRFLRRAAGVLVPVTLKRAGYDPALASSIFLTTVTDVMGFFTFLGLATVVLLR